MDPAGAGDQHPLAGEVAGDGLEVDVDLVATQEVGGGDVADVAGVDLAAEQLADRRQDLGPQTGDAGQLAQLGDQLGAGAGHGDEQAVGPALLGRLDQPGAVAQHRDAHDAQLALGRIVVDQADGEVLAVGVAHEGADDLDGPLAGAEDQQAVAGVGVGAAPAFEDQPPAVPDAGQQRESHHPADHGDALGHEPGIGQGVDDVEGDGGDDD